MSGTVDSRIVSMKFDNAQFESGVRTSMTTLERLKAALGNLTSNKKGLDDLNSAAKNFNMDHMGGAVDGISKKFLALSTIAITALANITNRAVDSGLALGKSFTVQPIIDGFHEYETNLKSIGTIQANTDRPLKEVEASLEEMNRFSDQTIYNFSEMAKNVGTFTAAGVDLQTATASIKGIANIAALSGSSSQQAATAMYQLSQAIASGKVGLQDWNSVVNAGMGGKKFQNALAQTAVAMGEIDKAQVSGTKSGQQLKIAGDSFRESIMAGPGKNSWLTSGVLTSTLASLDGRFSKTALAFTDLKGKTVEQTLAQNRLNFEQKYGVKYTEEQFAALTKMADASFKAATESKTFGDAMTVIKESIGSGWAESFKIIGGGLQEAKDLWTGVAQAAGGFIQAGARARNEMLEQWKAMGGRTALIDGFKNAFQAILSVLKPIKEAFREIFPAQTASGLFALTTRFRDFMAQLKLGPETAENLKRTFAGLFALLNIGMSVIKGVVGLVFRLFSSFTGGEGGILSVTASIGDFLVKLNEAIEKGGLIKGFFGSLGDAGETAASAVKGLAKAFSALFEGIDGSAIMDTIMGAFAGLGEAIGGVFSGLGAGGVTGGITAGLAGGIFLMVKHLIGSITNGGFLDKITGGLTGNISEAFGTLTGTLKAMQTQIKAKTLLMIAGAIALLTASVVVLASIDSKKLTKALSAMAVGFSQLVVVMSAIGGLGLKAGFVAIGLLAVAGSILILSAALKVMGSMSPSEIAKGLVAMGGALFLMTTAVESMSKNSKGIFRAGAALLMMSVGMLAIAVALKIMGSMSLKEMGIGMLGLAGALAVLAVGLRLMPKGMVTMGPQLLLISVALVAMATALKIMGSMSPEEIAKGLATMAGALLILGVAVSTMGSAIGGAIALTIISGALAILVPVLAALGAMPIQNIAIALGALAATFVVLGLAGLILTPVILPIMGLAIAIGLIGAGVGLAGAGILALSAGISALVSVGGQGIDTLVAAITAMLDLIPLALTKFGEGLVAFANVIATGAPAFVGAFVAVLTSLLDAVITVAPKIGQAFTVLIQTGLKVLRDNFPTFVTTGMALLMSLLNGISRNIGQITTKAADIVVKFLNALASRMPQITQAGVNLILRFVEGLTRAINNNAGRLGTAGRDLAMAIVNGMTGGLLGRGLEMVRNAATQLANAIPAPIRKIMGIASPSKVAMAMGGFVGEGLAIGLDKSRQIVSDSAGRVASAALNGMRATISRISEAVDSNMDLQPVIAPVLDLSSFRRDASQINSALSSTTLSAGVSLSQARAVSDERAVIAEVSTTSETPIVQEIKFEQTNISPKALSPSEIYRNTQSQLALAKGELVA